MRRLILTLVAWSLLPGGCVADQSRPAVEIRTVTVYKDVQRPCPVTVPTRPAPLTSKMPTDLAKFAATALAKLVEYAGPGRYADKADAAIKTCTNP